MAVEIYYATHHPRPVVSALRLEKGEAAPYINLDALANCVEVVYVFCDEDTGLGGVYEYDSGPVARKGIKESEIIRHGKLVKVLAGSDEYTRELTGTHWNQEKIRAVYMEDK